MNKLWCGKPCSECEHPCVSDEQTPCSLDCEAMNPDGSRNIDICKANICVAYKIGIGGMVMRNTKRGPANTFVRIDRGVYIWYDKDGNRNDVIADTYSLLPSPMTPLTNLLTRYELCLEKNDLLGALDWQGSIVYYLTRMLEEEA